MRISITAILVFFIYSISFAQGKGKECHFSPVWKKGDERTVISVSKMANYKDGVLDEESLENLSLSSVIKVSNETPTSYSLRVEMDNFIFKSFESLFEQIEVVVPSLDNIILMVEIDKKTLDPKILNWKEIQEGVQQNLDDVAVVVIKKIPALSESIDLMMEPAKSVFNDEESVSQFFMEQYGFLFTPLNKPLSKAKSYSKAKSVPNPFDPNRMMETEVRYIIEKRDRKNANCKIRSEVIYDLPKFMEMMKSMMKDMFDNISKEEELDQEVMDKEMEQLEALEINITNYQYVDYNYKTGWPTSAMSYSEIYLNDASGENKSITEINFTIK